MPYPVSKKAKTIFQQAIWPRWKKASRNAAMAAVAGTLAWLISYYLFGHPRPMFAAITAIICLAPGLPNHGLQGVSVVLGVTTGILVGEVMQHLPFEAIEWKILCGVPIAMILGASFGLPPVVMIQSGVSTVLILAFGAETAGFTRLIDVIIGSAIGLLFSQVLLTPDPMARLHRDLQDLLRLLSSNIARSAKALTEGNSKTAREATGNIFAAHEQLTKLDAAIVNARNTARWSLRGRIKATTIYNLATVYDRRIVRLYASVLLLSEAVGAGLRRHQRSEADPPPEGLINIIEQLSHTIHHFADGQSPTAALPLHVGKIDANKDGNIVWRRCIARIEDVYIVLERIDELRRDGARQATAAEQDQEEGNI